MQTLQEVIEDDTLIPEEEEVTREDMETESILHDNLEFDFLSDAEFFYKNYEGKESKDVWTAFDIFETNSIDMSKLDNLIFQKSKDFYILEKRRNTTIKCVGLLFTEEEATILRRYFTNLESPVFALVNLPEVVKGALFARY